MLNCTFHLNGGGFSTLSCPGIGFFPAYSGNKGQHRNNPDSVSIINVGPLPPGRYYIVQRPTGGPLNPLRDYINSVISGSDREVWFGLYRDDGMIDDFTFTEGVKRGSFRLHPAGYQGTSNGCITLPSRAHYEILYRALLRTPTFYTHPGLLAYGTIHVY